MGANRTVVVVEDDELMRAAMRSVLEASGYVAVVYDTAEDAFGASALERAHCAILDVGLPGMSGVELCRKMRDAAMPTPVILVTGRDAQHLRKMAHALGVAAFLVKPFSGRRLAAVVDGALPHEPREAVGRIGGHDPH